MKYIFVLLLLCFFNSLFAQQLTKAEIDEVHKVVASFCKLLSEYSESMTYVENGEQIQAMFSITGRFSEWVQDDLATDEKMISISTYLQTLSRDDKLAYSVQISYPENVYNIGVIGLSFSNHRDKSVGITHAAIKLTKQMKGSLNRKIKNVFRIKLEDLTITKIYVESDNLEEENENTLVDKAGKAKAEKRYADVLDLFEKAARLGNLDAMYQVGYMCYAKQGTEKLSSKERKNRAYYWLRRAAGRYSPYQQYDSESPVALARELLDRMGYYDE